MNILYLYLSDYRLRGNDKILAFSSRGGVQLSILQTNTKIT